MSVSRWVLVFCVISISLVFNAAHSADWPQWRGPKLDNLSTEKGLLKDWPKAGPKLLWTFKTAGEGYSCPAIVDGKLYLSGARDKSDVVFALDLKNVQGGAPKELWAVVIGPKFAGTAWNAGPIGTPLVDGGMIYALGGSGDLVCLKAEGNIVWHKSMLKDLEGEVNPVDGGIGAKEGEPKLGWGYSSSPIIDGDKLIVAPGGPRGTLAALDKKTGNVLWRSKDYTDQASYATPVIIEVGGIRQYVVLTNQGVAGVAAKDGALLWKYTRKPAYSSVVIPTPIVHQDQVFVTVGHGAFSAGCDCLKLTAQGGKVTVEKVYGNRNLLNHQGGVVLVDGYVYGHTDRRGWTCLELATGMVKWQDNSLGAGSLTYADGHLYCLTEEGGTVALVEANPTAWKEKGRFDLPEASKLRKPRGRIWTPPVIADGKLYLRDQELLFCYDVKGQ